MTNFNTGDQVVYKGKEYKIVAFPGAGMVALYADNEPNWSAIQVHIKDIEVVANKKFQIGDIVRSNGTFLGEVTGFEEEANRVVCASIHLDHHHSGDRRRYAYKASELEICPEVWKINRIYRIRFAIAEGEHTVRVLPGISDKTVHLYSTKTGELITVVDRKLGRRELREQGILSIREV